MASSRKSRGRKSPGSLNVERLYEAAARAEAALPDMVEKLIARFDSTQTVYDKDGNELGEKPISVKEQVMIVRALQSTALQKPRLEDAEGLIKRPSTSDKNPLLALLGGQINVQVINKLPVEEQERILLESLEGKIPALPTEAVITDTPNG